MSTVRYPGHESGRDALPALLVGNLSAGTLIHADTPSVGQ